MTGVQPYQMILMDFEVAEHEHLLTSCWTPSIQKLYGMSMELTTTFWYVPPLTPYYILTANW